MTKFIKRAFTVALRFYVREISICICIKGVV